MTKAGRLQRIHTSFPSRAQALFYCFTTRKWKYTNYYKHNMNWFSRLSSFFQLSAATGVNILDACGKMPARQILAFISNADIIWASASVFARRPLYLNNLSIYIISGNAQFSLEQRKATPHDCITHWVWNTAKWAVRACIQNRTYCMRGIKTAWGPACIKRSSWEEFQEIDNEL